MTQHLSKSAGYIGGRKVHNLTATQQLFTNIARIQILYADGERLITVVDGQGVELWRGSDFAEAGVVLRTHNHALQSTGQGA